MARPRSRTQTQDEELFDKFKKYIDNTALHIVTGKQIGRAHV